jgi:hypothetical protein
LLRRPRAPSARSGDDLKPTNRLTLRLVQRLSVRHVSNPLPTQTTLDNRQIANALEGAIKGPLMVAQTFSGLCSFVLLVARIRRVWYVRSGGFTSAA